MKALVISDIHGSGYYADKIKFEGFQPRSFKALWTKWETSPNRKADDERRSKLTKIADNE